MKNITFFVFILMSIGLSAQNNFWKSTSSAEFRSTLKERVSTPSKYRTISLDTESFLDFASRAGQRFSDTGANTLLITLPLPNGENETFTLEDSELMHPELAANYPQLKTYSGKGITDRTASLRITYSPYFGFSAMILSGAHSTVYIDPITSDNQHYMSYFRNDLSQTEIDFQCTTEEEIIESVDMNGLSQRAPALGDCNLRRYRLAQSCNGEYAQYHIGQAGGTTGTNSGDKAIVQAAMNVTMNRVNGVFERDLGITMQIVGNNDLIIYLDASTDPWTNEFSTTTAQTIDAQIGVSNYDIGHNFNTSGGGNAGCIDCVCLAVSQSGTHKGRGYTGRGAPIGDPFDIDYVAHEMGHQYGGLHVQSNQSCRSGYLTDVETGSGSTIMGYAGICSPNVQNTSDDYFAYVNIRDIVTSINFGNASGCAELIASGNSGPNADAGLDYSVPKSTPFILEGTGSDPNDSGLTYCWEQNNPENPSSNSAPVSTRTLGPMFRSIAPVAVPYRYFPNISAIINNTTPTFEVLPSVARNMDFSFIVRDNNSVSGCTASDLMTVTTVASAGPFIVLSPNTNVTWTAGETRDVTWDVAGTTAAPINCANVDIFLSTDGGNTYPITLATSVTNSGSYSIVVPNNQGNQNRIMVRGSNNIFFDISDADFTITAPVFCNATVPNGLAASDVSTTTANLSWDAVPGASYSLRYKESGTSTWTTVTETGVAYGITGLAFFTQYAAEIRSECSGGSYSSYSSTINFITLADTVAPVIYLNGNATIIDVLIGGTYTELGATAIDDIDGDLTASIVIGGDTVDTNILGTYTITFNVSDAFGNVAVERTRTVNVLQNLYCESIGNIIWETGVTRVIFGTIDNADGPLKDVGYENFTNISTAVNQSSTVDLTVNVYTDGGYTVHAIAWIDWNQNGDFTDSGEAYDLGQINVDGALPTLPILIPATAQLGSTRMRVSARYSSDPTPCLLVDFDGEVEDYTIIVEPAPDTEAPVITLNGGSPVNVGGVNGTYTELGATATDIVDGDLTTSIIVGGDTVDTSSVGTFVVTYNVSDAAGNNAVEVTRTVNVIVPDYCTSNGNISQQEYINRVELNAIDNNSSGPGTSGTGYSDFSNLSTDLYSGRQYTITITPEWAGQIFAEGYAVWIDYNYDGDFDDSGEQVLMQSATQNTSVSGSFTVPDDIAFEESTRMRVSMKYNNIPTACESFSSGEVEDYIVNLAYDGLLFMNNAWIPNAPSDITALDNALVLDGTYTVGSSIALNNLTVNDIGTIDVLEGESIELTGDLINNGDVILNSSSNQYASLIVDGTVTEDVVYKRHVNVNASSGGNDLISAPVTGQAFGAFATVNANIVSNQNTTTEKLFGPFDKATETYLTLDTNVPSEASVILNPGIGYRAASTDDGTFEFKGTVNTGAVNVDIFNSGGTATYPEWNLIGNPYPSYIKLSDFLTLNINAFLSSSAAVYGYNGDTSNGWKIWNMAYALANPNSIITPGQGFFVSSELSTGMMVFNPSFRTNASGNALLDDDFIDDRAANSSDIAYLELAMNSNLNSYSTDFYFTDMASRGLDPGYDASAFNGIAPNYAIYSRLIENSAGLDMSIQSVSFNDLNNNLIIPLGLNAAQGEQIIVSMSNITLPSDVNVYLEDNLTNTFTLLNSNDYNFTAENNLSGIGRFYLRFETTSLGTVDNELNELLVYTTENPRDIVIKGTLLNTTKAMLYDITGREVLFQSLDVDKSLQTIDVNTLSSGVYIFYIQSATSNTSRKIIIK